MHNCFQKNHFTFFAFLSLFSPLRSIFCNQLCLYLLRRWSRLPHHRCWLGHRQLYITEFFFSIFILLPLIFLQKPMLPTMWNPFVTNEGANISSIIATRLVIAGLSLATNPTNFSSIQIYLKLLSCSLVQFW
ncbi:uncharacterized protein LOC112092082 [Morus notabilis]|uniref:uncharacterized protein LOC112092082 n=1 Tax=Morus notabilis TaxID=981085 RepID=UPI000CECE790|nr:uncharacterized protein LOC112092082 [Morus notabilis]